MKTTTIYITMLLLGSLVITSCKHDNTEDHKHDTEGNHIETPAVKPTHDSHEGHDHGTTKKVVDDEHAHEEEIKLTQKQIDILDIKIGELTLQNM